MKGETNDWKYNHNNRKASLSSDFSLEPSKPFIFEKRTVFQTNRDFYSEQLSLDGIEHLSFEELFEEHKIIWKKRWANSDIILEGDNQSQLALRVSLYHLLRAYVPDDSRVAIDDKGYAGEAYWGRFFWDIEMYLLPFFLFTNPSKAKTLVEFRIKSLEGARRNAQRYGYSGARYAWESDPEGNECCPNWQYADHEVHITADVVFGLMQYSIATGDSQCLEQAAPVFVETARYWLERIDIIDGEFHLLGVMGPDEYKPITNDNFYTNLLVSYALHLAAQYGEMVGVSKKECAAFAEASEKLPLLKNSKGVYEQCEGFERFAEPNFNTFWKNREETFASNVSQERLYRTKCLKQADVLMGVYLFPERFTQEDLSKAWEYYLPYTTHDSSLSAGIHAILACRLGKAEIAWEFWKKSSGIDINGGSAEGIHIASAGANWQIIVFGFAGVSNSLTSTTLRLNPYLPDQISRIAFPIVWKGIPVYIDVRKNEVTLENRGEKELSACIWEKEIEVKPKNSINIRY
jgi:kojibiose phosphorylase